MKAIAAKQSSNETKRSNKGKVKTPVPSAAKASVFSSQDIAIQRKPTCPCGGGCPRCEEELPIQTKLTISEPGHRYEQEADRVAEQVMRMPEPQVSSLVGDSAQANSTIHQREHGFTVTSPVVHDALNSVGQPLDLTTRSNFESRFGHDFSAVRVHHDPVAQKSARRLHAKAYTVGQDIVFSKGHYSPDSRQGRELIAEELAHTIQQGRGGDVPKLDPSAAHEQDAKTAAKAAVNDSGPVAVRSATGVGIARSIDEWLDQYQSLDISYWSPTQLLDEADEIQQWLNNQIQSTPDSMLLEEALDFIRAEIERKKEVLLQLQKKKTRDGKRESRRKRKSEVTQTDEPALQKPRILRERTSVQISDPDEIRKEVDLIVSWLHWKDLPPDEREMLQFELQNLKPRILRERTSVQISDPDEIREEVDLIMSWLQWQDLLPNEREILQIELENLEPSLIEARVQKVAERRAIKIEQALTPEFSEDALVQMVEAQKLIDNIIPLPNKPGYSSLMYGDEMIVVENSEVEAKRQGLIKIRDKAEFEHSLLIGPKRETVVPYATAEIIGKSFGISNITPKEMENFLRGDVKGFVKNASKHAERLKGKQVEALQRMANLFALNNQVAVGARKKEDVSSKDWGYIKFMMAETQLQSKEDREVREGFQTSQGAYSRMTSKRHERLLKVFREYNMSRGDFMDLMVVAEGTDENMYSMRDFFEEKAIDEVSGKIIMATIEIEMLLMGGAAFTAAKTAHGVVRVGIAVSEGAGLIASANELPEQIGSIVGNSYEAKTGLEYAGASEEFSRKVTAGAGIVSLATGLGTGLLSLRHTRQLDKAGRLVLALEAPSIETAEAFVKGVSRQARVEAGAALEEMVNTSTRGLGSNAYRTVDKAATTPKVTPEVTPAPKPTTQVPATQPLQRAWNDPTLTENELVAQYKQAGVKKPLDETVVRAKYNEGRRFDPATHRWSKPHKLPGSRPPRAPTGPFMRDQLKKVSDPKHPLHGLVLDKQGADGKVTYDWHKTTRVTETGKTQTGRYEASETHPIVQAGHPDAYASGATQKYVLEDADLNQLSGQTIESKGAYSFKIAVEVDGVWVDMESLKQWERLGVVPKGTVAKAKR